MSEPFIYITCFFVGILLLAIFWAREIGILRALLAAIARVGWITPIFLCLWPISEVVETRLTTGTPAIHILIDDSISMTTLHPTNNQKTRKLIEEIQETCQRLGCKIKRKRLSEIAPKNTKEYSPLNPYATQWIEQVTGEPWILISDGGDWRPQAPWPLIDVLKTRNDQDGLILSFNPESKAENFSISQVSLPEFAFEESVFEASLSLNRSGDLSAARTIQVQVLLGNSPLRSINITFQPGEAELDINIKIPALSKGQHLLTFRALPTAEENIIWDNEYNEQLEVMANTIGVLHLLGAPSWDGRFLRRYLKSEPKYDIISFFILRDPWDQQQVNERELSLIPFPVNRLFNEELASFRVVVIQNFSLFQFLEPSLQSNLVKFVKNGGGVLFIGGPRALQSEDLTSSALVDILPFEPPKSLRKSNNIGSLLQFNRNTTVDRNAPYYDESLSFEVSLANPSSTSRELASVYDEWSESIEQLSGLKNTKGIHRMEKVTFKPGKHTPLLTAKTSNPAVAEIPLAVASYPGKGRAIWLFSDQFWNLAMTQNQKTPRQSYNNFMNSALSWLMRKEIQKPLIAKQILLTPGEDNLLDWQVTIQGPAIRYFSLQNNWRFQVCNQLVDNKSISFKKLGITYVNARGRIKSPKKNGSSCTLKIIAEHPAFGQLTTSITGVIPETFRDLETTASTVKLKKLSLQTGATLIDMKQTNSESLIREWILKRLNSDDIAAPNAQRNRLQYFWPMYTWWLWLLILLLPVEVLIRRWHLLSM